MLAIFYARGAATPAEIITSLKGMPKVFVVLEDSDPTLSRLFQRFARVVVFQNARQAARELSLLGTTGLVTFAESMLPALSAVGGLLGLPSPSDEVVELLQNKAAQRTRLAERGVQSSSTQTADQFLAFPPKDLGPERPFIVKPLIGESSRNTMRIHSVSDLDSLRATEDLERFITEEFFLGLDMEPFGDFVSVESVIHGGRTENLAVLGKFQMSEPFREHGHFWPSTLIENDEQEVMNLTRRSLEALDPGPGVYHTEVKCTPLGPRVIEVNGRLGGQVGELLLRALGVDLIQIAASIAVGTEVSFLSPPAAASRVKIHFQYHNLAPDWANRLVAFSKGAVSEVAGIERYQTFVRPPADLPRDGRTFWLDALCGSANNHRQILDVIGEAQSCLTFEFD